MCAFVLFMFCEIRFKIIFETLVKRPAVEGSRSGALWGFEGRQTQL